MATVRWVTVYTRLPAGVLRDAKRNAREADMKMSVYIRRLIEADTNRRRAVRDRQKAKESQDGED